MSPNPRDEDDDVSGHWNDVENGPFEDREMDRELSPLRGQDNANLIYILYLINIAIPFCGIVGVIMAYSARERAGPDLRSHYDNQIRIFWTTVIGYTVAIVLTLILVGFLLMLVVFIWKIVRVATGMSLLARGEPVWNVASLSFVSD